LLLVQVTPTPTRFHDKNIGILEKKGEKVANPILAGISQEFIVSACCLDVLLRLWLLVCLLQLYTAAINACMANDGTDFETAFEIYATMQRHGLEPDDLLYGHLIALAGRCRKLEVRPTACCKALA
jgi:pentatricopeptide repeat protein